MDLFTELGEQGESVAAFWREPRTDAQDRRQRPPLDRPYVAPRDAVELRLTRLAENLLGLWGLGVYDDFFALGGGTLLVGSLLSAVEREFDRQLAPSSLAESPTIDRLAQMLTAGPAPKWSSLLVLQTGVAERAPLFWLHGEEGWPLGYEPLLRHLGPEQPAFGLVLSGLDGRSPLHARLEDMAAHYAREIRSVQPHGPYHLVGPRAAGIGALAVAGELQAAGEEVGLLALFGAPWPGDVRPACPSAFGLRLRWAKHECARRLGIRECDAYGPELVAFARECCRLAWQRFQPEPYPGRATLFLARDELTHEVPTVPAQWRQFLASEPELIAVRCDPGVMLHEPYVQQVAARFAERMTRPLAR